MNLNRSEVVAVVVSYNRRDLLRMVLQALQNQTAPLNATIVVDNGSSDGSAQMIQTEFPRVTLIRAGGNLGGAGGFATGVAWALAKDIDYVWLMDDDAVPYLDCLELLLAGMTRPGLPKYAVIAPHVVDSAGLTGPRNYPMLSKNYAQLYAAVEQGLVPIDACSFVGPLIRASAAKSTHLPLSEFFIWHDDVEYTSRLCNDHGGALAPSARIMHLANNPGPSHYNGDRNVINARNRVWWFRELPTERRSMRLRVLYGLTLSFKGQLYSAPSKLRCVRDFALGVVKGLRRSPAHLNDRQLRDISAKRDLIEPPSA